MNIAIIFASGSGARMGAGIPKQFLEVNSRPLIVYTLNLFQRHKKIHKIYISTRQDYIPYVENLVEEFRLSKVAGVVAGGETAQDSIYAALCKAREENDENSIVLLHDGVRPFVSYDVITENIKCVKENGNAITCIPSYETTLLSDDGVTVDRVPLRKVSYIAQAPQSFYLKDILDVHERIRAMEHGYDDMVDSCTMLRALGIKAYMVHGNRGNIKVTTPEDVFTFRALLQYKETESALGYGLTDQYYTRFRQYTDPNSGGMD